jgi:hypothetical protein
MLERSVMVSADLVHLPMEMVHSVRERVAKRFPDWDVSKIFISTTHTHHAPVVMRGNFIIPEGVMTIEEYLEFFAERVSKTIIDAQATLAPGSVAWGLGHAQIAYNRRIRYLDGHARMSGATDSPDFKGFEGTGVQGIPALFFFDQAGIPRAVAANPWSPSQVLRFSNKISADFWHPARERLKAALGEDLVVLGWCGPAGDQMQSRRVHTEAEERMRRLRGVDSWTEEFGRRLGECVLETYTLVKEDHHADAKLVHHVEILRLPGWKLSEAQITHIRGQRDGYAKELAGHPERAGTLARPISWRSQTLERQRELAASPDGAYPCEIHLLRIGDIAICTNPFELFSEYGLRILGRSIAHLTFAVQLVGPAHYLPTTVAVQGGSYSAIPESCAVGPEGGQMLVDQTVHGIQSLWSNLKPTLPKEGVLSTDGKPPGEGWVDLLADADGWNRENQFWQFNEGQLHGESIGGDYHFAWTKQSFTDFEAHVVLRLRGRSGNSGVCLRVQPTGPNNAAGYQVDMGANYWGCLWEEGGAGMVQKFDARSATAVVRHQDWNHYYIVAKGHHLQAWLNGVKTIDIEHRRGPLEGALGFELCHGNKHTVLDVKTLKVRESK